MEPDRAFPDAGVWGREKAGFYPLSYLTNVAVKAVPDAAYTDGSGAMTVKSINVWRAE